MSKCNIVQERLVHGYPGCIEINLDKPSNVANINTKSDIKDSEILWLIRKEPLCNGPANKPPALELDESHNRMTSMFHPLPTIRQYNSYNDYRHIINAKRKSAAEVLAETKPLYVKSPSALKSQSPEDKHKDEASSSPRIATHRKQERSCDLECKLRRLLDSKENLTREDLWEKTDVQYKSLPDLSTSSHESLGSTLHHVSCMEGGGSVKADTASSTTETGCSSSEKSYGKPPSLTKSALSMGGSAGRVESRLSWRTEEHTKCELIRSKSDPGETGVTQDSELPLKLEEFFRYLGLSGQSYRNLTRLSSNASSPIYFPSGSSLDSSPRDRGSGGGHGSNEIGLSIVERNARVIKWLVACGKS